MPGESFPDPVFEILQRRLWLQRNSLRNDANKSRK